MSLLLDSKHTIQLVLMYSKSSDKNFFFLNFIVIYIFLLSLIV
jgi:hypothetical protein